jgi:hypothetical protein
MDSNHDLPVHVPDGYALVPLGGGQAHVRPADDWAVAVPPYDPQSQIERWWSLIMRWPRRGARAFLYGTLTWKRSAVAVGVFLVLIMVIKAYYSTS